MADQRLEILAGAAVIVVALGFAVYAGRDTGLSSQAGSYALTASFRSIEGVAVGADVKLAGVKIGTIAALDLNPQSYMADATIMIDKTIEIPTDSIISVSQDGLLGGKYVEILPGGMPDVLAPGEEIENTQDAVNLLNLLNKFVGGGTADETQPAPDAGAASP